MSPGTNLLSGFLGNLAGEIHALRIAGQFADEWLLDGRWNGDGWLHGRIWGAMVRAVPLGDGFFDLDGFFRGLKDGGFSGYVAYEMCSPLRGGGSLKKLDMTARKSLVKIKALIRD